MYGKTLPLFAFMVLFLGLAQAQSLPSHYPERFQRTGRIDDVRRETIVINDVPYSLSDEVIVHSFVSAAESTVSILRDGMKIGYQVGDQRRIAEIWILPDWYDETRNRR